jgi:hypothetical protein
MTQRKPRPTAAQNYRTQIYKLQERVRRAFDRGEMYVPIAPRMGAGIGAAVVASCLQREAINCAT